jgi:hypothetical protein
MLITVLVICNFTIIYLGVVHGIHILLDFFLKENKKKKKRQPKTAIVSVKEEAHLSAAPPEPVAHEGAAEAVPVVSQQDSVSTLMID